MSLPLPRNTPTASEISSTLPPSRRRFFQLSALSGVGVLALSACASNDSLARQANAGDNKNFIAGDGSVAQYAINERKEPVVLAGKLFDGTAVSSTAWAGKVVVLNFWYAACSPCRLEAPRLEALYQEFKADGVLFYGVNIRDREPEAAAFERTFGVTYPSMEDSGGGVLLAMTQYVPPQAVPTTLVLDKAGRVASRILGLADQGTLKALIADAVAGK
ncbi:TlpA family protein disulfide reductase [Arthrobacter cryoconiti]|uniref:TlpA family protein disulfide reductase n=1 Tax=Arthrobacter cryoconiti TaxID=748907 RepID=A0ABV8R7K5_9MICC|nr:TlpA disulfide reductase family protein [Arthrobacter cryoconiti]MCC9069376.1 TlpA family protein disulfide reductase [Arthrobacter cryoconiti]